jgi:ribosomal protein S12 methylthiotransferase RimO
MKKLYLVSLGCTKNLIDSEVMLSRLKNQYELSDDIKNADLIIVNSCGFIQSAKEESLDTIFELDNQRKPDSVLVMAGCLSERYKDELQKELVEVDIFTGVGDYDKIDQLVEQKQNKFSQKVFLMSEVDDRVISGSNYHAYIKLSEGCNQTCSFCAIPNFKGKLQSRNIESIIAELKKLIKNGFYDFTFVSQDSSSYLRDFNINNGLEQLIDKVEILKGIKSARILYLYPSTTTFSLINKIANSKIFHSYYDIPLQHISSNMLKVMKRGKGSEKLKELLNAMKKVPDSFIRTTFIVGHPYETQEDFNELCKFVEEFEFDRANVFSYSDEENTYSYTQNEKIAQDIIDKRAEKLGKIITKTTKKSLKKEIGKTIKIVIDGQSDEHEYLLSAKKLMLEKDIDGEIYVNDNQLDIPLQYGKIYKAKITQLVGDKLLATVIK